MSNIELSTKILWKFSSYTINRWINEVSLDISTRRNEVVDIFYAKL